MSPYSLKNAYVKRVCLCLSNKWRSLDEVTRMYNSLYPPGLVRSIIGIEMGAERIKPILSFLVRESMVEREVFGYTDRPLPNPIPHYRITAKGRQFVSTKKK